MLDSILGVVIKCVKKELESKTLKVCRYRVEWEYGNLRNETDKFMNECTTEGQLWDKAAYKRQNLNAERDESVAVQSALKNNVECRESRGRKTCDWSVKFLKQCWEVVGYVHGTVSRVVIVKHCSVQVVLHIFLDMRSLTTLESTLLGL